jgi:hypothetical protein
VWQTLINKALGCYFSLYSINPNNDPDPNLIHLKVNLESEKLGANLPRLVFGI